MSLNRLLLTPLDGSRVVHWGWWWCYGDGKTGLLKLHLLLPLFGLAQGMGREN